MTNEEFRRSHANDSKFKYSQVHKKGSQSRPSYQEAKRDGLRSNWSSIVDRARSWKRRADTVTLSRKTNSVNPK